MDERFYFTEQERELLFILYKKLLQLTGDALQKGDSQKLKHYLTKGIAEGNGLLCRSFEKFLVRAAHHACDGQGC